MNGRAEKQKQLVGHVMMILTVRTKSECFLMCMATLGCVSTNVCNDLTSEGVRCDLNDAVSSVKEANGNCLHYELDVATCN